MINGFLGLLNVVFAVALLLSAFTSYINPNSIWQLSFAGLLFPPLLVLNLLFVLFWLLRRHVNAVISVISMMLCSVHISAVFALNLKKNDETYRLCVMSWNVKNFDLYNWTGNKATRQKMLKIIKEFKPDILCLQEFYTDEGVIMDNISYLKDSLGYAYYHFDPSVSLHRTHCNKPIYQRWGVATFSKFPITGQKRVDFANSLSNDCIYTDIVVEKDTLRIFNMHLQSLHLDEKDYQTLQKMEKSGIPDWIPMKRILRKMKFSYQKRSYQAEQVAKFIRKYNGMQLVCGDLNDIPVSYTYRTIIRSKNLKDAFAQCGFGFGGTYVINPFSPFRIDYILGSEQINFLRCNKINTKLSDHFPVYAEFTW
ncbi:MAG: endonuclease/exonuclease/phosphatase family protein [Chitinophagales bacterium]|nr:endonuclease/exonuclease/phosphatase family protein [Chitinophagales bacterium]MDW8274120.1 endonuclease/exonuclease/phosphatase family protein [Chitinophagales bacterium]